MGLDLDLDLGIWYLYQSTSRLLLGISYPVLIELYDQGRGSGYGYPYLYLYLRLGPILTLKVLYPNNRDYDRRNNGYRASRKDTYIYIYMHISILQCIDFTIRPKQRLIFVIDQSLTYVPSLTPIQKPIWEFFF